MSAPPFVFPLQPMRSAEPMSSLLHTRFQSRAKRGRGKAVSWPPEDQICQIQFFLSNDAPASIASGQAVFQSNYVRSLSSQGRYLDASLDVPPGFHGAVAKRARINIAMDVAMSTEMAWCYPPKFIQDCDWLVADGHESKDTEVQKQRELRVLEAFYPRLTSIPDSPSEPAEAAKCIDDNLVPTIPLVAIEEEDEYSQDVVKEESVSDMGVTGHGKRNNDQKPKLSSSGFPAQPPISSKPLQEPTMDPKVAVAAAAAAACLAIHTIEANGRVDQDLLLELLRNPALLKGLTLFNATRKDFTGPMNQNEIGLNGQATKNLHIISECVEALNKGSHGTSLNTGFPSPVSVLSDWAPEPLSKNFQKTPSNLSNSGDSSAKTMTSFPSLPSRQSRSVYPSSNNGTHAEPVSTTSQGVHAFAEESRPGINVVHKASSQATSLVHVDRSCGAVAALAPFPSQNMGNFNLNRVQPVQAVSSAPVMHDGVINRSSYADARTRGMHYEIPALGFMSKKTSRLCMYFNNPRGCRNGGSCAFVHQFESRAESYCSVSL